MTEQLSPYRIVEPHVDANGVTIYRDAQPLGSSPPAISPPPQPPAGAPTPIAGPRMVGRVPGQWFDWVDLPEDCEYAGGRVYAWINRPKVLDDALGSGDAERAVRAFVKIVRDHEGLASVVYDEEGEPVLDEYGQPQVEPYPPADTRAFFDAIPERLVILIFAALRGKAMTLPASMAHLQRR